MHGPSKGIGVVEGDDRAGTVKSNVTCACKASTCKREINVFSVNGDGTEGYAFTNRYSATADSRAEGDLVAIRESVSVGVIIGPVTTTDTPRRITPTPRK